MTATSIPTCANCGKPRDNHLAKTHHCPVGKKHRTLGYNQYHKTNVFVAKLPKRKSMKWREETSRRHGTDKGEPTTYAARTKLFTVSVHRHVHYEKDDWLLSCAPMFECRLLKSKDADSAKAEGLKLVREALKATYKELANYA